MQTAEHIDYKALYEDTVVKYEDTAVKFEDLQVKYEALQQEVAHLKKMIFGSKHERFIPTENNPAQLTLNVQADQIAQCNIIDAKKISYTKITSQVTQIKEHPGRMKLPEYLERRDRIIEPAE